MINLENHRDAVARLLNHAAVHVPYYRDQDWAKRLRSGRIVPFLDLPVTTLSTVKQHTSSFYSDLVPLSEGPIFDKFTSGSTGEPVLIKKTGRHFQINAGENKRLRQGWGYETQTGFISTTSPTKDHKAGSVERRSQHENSKVWKHYSREPKPTIEFLCRTKCSHIGMYPSQALAVLEISPPLDFLRLITTFGEIIPPELPQLIATLPQRLHHDVYGSIETGIIASRCRECSGMGAAWINLRLYNWFCS